ncbi:MAG: zinc ribbon domain-containing protein, partial [Thermoplasmata archaeon]
HAVGQAEAPLISIGNTWKYSVELSLSDFIGEMEEGFENVTLQGTVTMVVKSRQIVEVLNRSYDTWAIDLLGDFDVGFAYTVPDLGTITVNAPAETKGTVYLDNETFEYVKTSFTTTSHFRRFTITFDLLLEAETSLNISTDSWNFPYDVGSVGITSGSGVSFAHYVMKMSGTVMAENETSASFSYNPTYECTKKRNVTVEAGAFRTYKVTVSSPGIYFFGPFDGYRHEFYSNGVNNIVRAEVYSNENELLGEWELLSYEESPASARGGLEILLVILIIIAVILILIAIFVLRSSRRKTTEDTPGSAVSMNCRRCGSEIPEGQGICPSCGRAIR